MRYTWLDSGYMLCINTSGFWTNFPVFLVELDSDPEAFLSVLRQNGELSSVNASGYGPCMRCLREEVWIFCELHADGTRHDDQ